MRPTTTTEVGGAVDKRTDRTAAMVAELKRNIVSQAIRPLVYTYPPRSAYVPQEAPTSIREVWRADILHSGPDLNLYLHIPFCPYRCTFCNLYTVTGAQAEDVTAYARTLAAQLVASAEIIQTRRLRTINFGGGTPTIFTASDFEIVFKALDSVCSRWRSTVEEVSVEATPDTLSNPSGLSYLRDLHNVGIDRINVGVQTLMELELRRAGRFRANAGVVERAFETVRSAGTFNLSTDLIIGLPEQTEASWRSTIETLIQFCPDTVSTYFLTVRSNSGLARAGRVPAVDPAAWYRRYDVAREMLANSEYAQETNVRYTRLAKGGLIQKRLQFQGVPTLGIGAGARSYNSVCDYIVGGHHNASLSQIRDYLDRRHSGDFVAAAGCRLDGEERFRKRAVLDMFDLELSELQRLGLRRYECEFQPILDAAIEMALLDTSVPGKISLTARGVRHRDAISRAFFSERVWLRDRRFYTQPVAAAFSDPADCVA